MNNILQNMSGKWRVEMDSTDGIVHLGMDSEGTGRQTTNLLAGPVTLTCDGKATEEGKWNALGSLSWSLEIRAAGDVAAVWTVSRDGEDLVWEIDCRKALSGLRLNMPIDPLIAGVVILPGSLDASNQALQPWLMVAPDFGHLLIQVESPADWVCTMDGDRSYNPNAPEGGVDPRLRGRAWLDAVSVTIPHYKHGKLGLRFARKSVLPSGSRTTFRFRSVELNTPEGISSDVWKRIRRPYLNNWQPNSMWCGAKMAMILANNALSDAASCSLWFYSEPMLFFHELVPGIDVQHLLRRSLDYYLDNAVSVQGHVNVYGQMNDLNVYTGAALLISAWDFWTISQDREWLQARIGKLHLLADYLLRRDVDQDGLVESYGSGNSGTFRAPSGADVWFDFMNFGHKNTWTNLIAYRAFLCLAEMMGAIGQRGGAAYYCHHASRLRSAFVRRFLDPTHGWFVSWVSQDGEVHDYCHTFINGMAVAYGLIDPGQGRKVLSRVVAQSKSIGFTNWHLGVPGNLLPCRKGDMVQAEIGIDGQPIRNNFYWPDDLSEEAAFGTRYPNGTIHPTLVWPYLLGLQVAGLEEEADRILNAMIASAEEGLFQNGIHNVGYGGAEHFYFNGKTCGYEGYLPESYNFLMACFTKNPAMRRRPYGTDAENRILHLATNGRELQ